MTTLGTVRKDSPRLARSRIAFAQSAGEVNQLNGMSIPLVRTSTWEVIEVTYKDGLTVDRGLASNCRFRNDFLYEHYNVRIAPVETDPVFYIPGEFGYTWGIGLLSTLSFTGQTSIFTANFQAPPSCVDPSNASAETFDYGGPFKFDGYASIANAIGSLPFYIELVGGSFSSSTTAGWKELRMATQSASWVMGELVTVNISGQNFFPEVLANYWP